MIIWIVPQPAAPLVKGISNSRKRKFDMLFKADPHPRITFAQTYSQVEPLPPKRGRGLSVKVKIQEKGSSLLNPQTFASASFLFPSSSSSSTRYATLPTSVVGRLSRNSMS